MTIDTLDESCFQNDLITPMERKESSVKVFNFIKLNPGISRANFFCCILFYMVMVFSYAVPGSLQPLIILHHDYYNIPQNQAGKITSMVLIIQLVVKILVSIPYGHLADKFGRKLVIVYATLNYLVGSLLIPAQTSLFPGFIIAKALSANSASAFATVPLLADYIADESKGKAAALVVMFFGVGGLSANIFAKVLLYKEISLGTCYILTGALVFAAMCFICLGLKSNYPTHIKHLNISENRGSFIQQTKEAISIFKGNGWLRILLVLQILGSSDFMVFFTFMTIFVKSLFPENVEEATQNIVVNNLQTLVVIPMILGNIGYGYFLDKKNMLIRIAIFALAGGAVSFMLIANSSSPYSWTIDFGAIMLGATLPGLFVISNYLGIKNYPPDKRGIMVGFSGLVGYIGYFIIATGGGILYDSWRKEGPFLICTGLLLVAICLVLVIYRNMDK